MSPMANSIIFCLSSTVLFFILMYRIPNILNSINASFGWKNNHLPIWIESHLKKVIFALTIVSAMSYIRIIRLSESSITLQIIYIGLFLVIFFSLIYYSSDAAINKRGFTGWVYFIYFWFFVGLISLTFVMGTYIKFPNVWTHFIWSATLIVIVLSIIILYFFILVRVNVFLLSPVKIFFSGIMSYLIINSFVITEFGIVNFYNGLAGDTSKIVEVEFTHLIYAGSKYLFSFPSGKEISEIQSYDLIPVIQYYFGVVTNLLILPFMLSYFVSVIVTLRSNRTENPLSGSNNN
ncbi:hypothetical protein J31TS6_22990 [Brevibacillus reuszeri]|uniref:hypothetical protein n=1 Tax=Brevibacillus reuszeri TaxID=54915 RepID=UPI001B0CE999|nr:hypothetical protein [Brevibacillus reuszeri]GIO06271.1 hypothetical protein J31TS6_22990 [Brevibacillus reuszeri]